LGERCIGKDLEERGRGVTDGRYAKRDSKPELPKTGVQIYRHANLLSKKKSVLYCVNDKYVILTEDIRLY